MKLEEWGGRGFEQAGGAVILLAASGGLASGSDKLQAQ